MLVASENDYLKEALAFLAEKWRYLRWRGSWRIRGYNGGVERVDEVDEAYIAFGECDEEDGKGEN